MTGIYIHIPFCRKACHYCNFHFSTSLKLKDDVLVAIEKEIRQNQTFLSGHPTVATIYFGGGTPSYIEPEYIGKLMQAIHDTFNVISNAEVTLEANPDDITPEKLQIWKQQGINRLSVGIQSFNNEELKWMGRTHTAEHSAQCLHWIKEAGFTNYSADLIFGSPLLSAEDLKKHLQILLEANVPHLSCYALTVEPKTALAAHIKHRKCENVNPEIQSQQFLMLMDILEKAGYEHYEISNFALPGMRSKHNSSYWKGLPYLGFGPAAHSFNGQRERRWNISNNAVYVKKMQMNEPVFTSEILTEADQWNEMIMISLRTQEGINITEMNSRFGATRTECFKKDCIPYIQKRYIEEKGDYIFLTPEGKLFADGIASDFFI